MNIKGIKRIFKNGKGIIAISLAATITAGISIANAYRENRKNSDRDNLFSEYSQSEVVEISDDSEKEYLNVFDIQMDETRIVKMSDKNGIDITKYVKDCSIIKTEESKIYLDNGYIIYYDNDGFKYITGDIYKYDVTDPTNSKLITNVIAYVNKDINKVIGYDDCENIYDSGVNYEQIVNDLLNDEKFINFCREECSFDDNFGELSSLHLLGQDVTDHNGGEYVSNNKDLSEVIGIFRFYDGREEEFEEVFGFPMYVINNDGLKVYNIYKLAIINHLISINGDFTKYLFENYNQWLVELNKVHINDESKEELIKKINKELSQSSSVRINLTVYTEDNYAIFWIYNSYIDEITNNGDLILVNSDNSKIIIKYDDLINTDRHYSVDIETYDFKQPSIFYDYNINSSQYGGNQMTFSYYAEDLLEDSVIIDKLRESYPDASMEDYELYLNKLCSTGCGYVAGINTLFKEYENQTEEFEKIFGFPMYTFKDGKIDFNYEYLILDYFNYVWANTHYTIERLYYDIGKETTDGALTDSLDTKSDYYVNTGIYSFVNAKFFLRYLKAKYNLDFVYSSLRRCGAELDLNGSINDEIKNEYIRLKNDSNHIVVFTDGCDLYDMKGEIYRENVGSHAMYVTGLTEDGRLIVSTWGIKCILDFSDYGVDEYEEDGTKINKVMELQSIQYK